MLALTYDPALRREELCALRTDDIELPVPSGATGADRCG
jgi:hypothetical protein